MCTTLANNPPQKQKSPLCFGSYALKLTKLNAKQLNPYMLNIIHFTHFITYSHFPFPPDVIQLFQPTTEYLVLDR